MTNRFVSGSASLTLKIVGIILILAFLVDFFILLLPFQPTDRLWQINLATVVVERGIVPLVGIGMLFMSYSLDSFSESDRPRVSLDLRFPVLVFASVLGLIYLLIFPLHLNNVRQASVQNIEQIRQDAEQAESQLQNQLEQLRQQARNQLNQLLRNEEAFQQALNNPQLPPAQKEQLQKFKEDPAELERFIQQQTDPQAQATQRVTQIRQRREQAEKQARENAWRSGMRIGVNSLLLAIGYIIIGWTGLRNMGALQGSKRKVAPR